MSNGIFTMKKDLQCGPTVYWNPPKARSIPALLYLQITHESRIVNKRLKKQKKGVAGVCTVAVTTTIVASRNHRDSLRRTF